MNNLSSSLLGGRMNNESRRRGGMIVAAQPAHEREVARKEKEVAGAVAPTECLCGFGS